jgi:predicted O-methyltransferase YrrM
VSSGSQKDLAILHNLAHWVEAENILELGTNLGLGTIALSATSSAKKVVSIEGDPILAAMAVKNLQKFKSNAEVIAGSFEDNLDLALNKLKTIDLAYLDGNHKKTPTLNYFDRIKEYSHNDTVIVVGDIHWSEEMEEAWDEIKSDRSVAATADVFSMGLVFFKKELSKEHFILYG